MVRLIGVVQTLEELRALLAYAEVGRGVGVQNLVHSQRSKGGDELSGREGPGRSAELLGEGDANRGGGLRHHEGRGVQRGEEPARLGGELLGLDGGVVGRLLGRRVLPWRGGG